MVSEGGVISPGVARDRKAIRYRYRLLPFALAMRLATASQNQKRCFCETCGGVPRARRMTFRFACQDSTAD